MRDTAALDNMSPGVFYSSRVRKLSSFAPCSEAWCDVARQRERGRRGRRRRGEKSDGGIGGSGFASSSFDPPLLYLDPNGDIEDPLLYGATTMVMSTATTTKTTTMTGSNSGDGASEAEKGGVAGRGVGVDVDDPLAASLDATVAQLRLATQGLVRFLYCLEERRHRLRRSGGDGVGVEVGAPPLKKNATTPTTTTTAKTKARAQAPPKTPPPTFLPSPPLLSLHAALRQAVLCPLLSPDAERGGRGPSAARIQSKVTGWRPVWQEEGDDGDGDGDRSFSSFSSSSSSPSSPSLFPSPPLPSDPYRANEATLYTLATARDGRKIITRKRAVARGHWMSAENVDAALLRYLEKRRRRQKQKRLRWREGKARDEGAEGRMKMRGEGEEGEEDDVDEEKTAPEDDDLFVPTQAELRAAGESSLAKSVLLSGGTAAAARRLGLRSSYRARGSSGRDAAALAVELQEVAREVAAASSAAAGAGAGAADAAADVPLLTMPTQAQLRLAGRGELIHDVRRLGGTRVVAELAGLSCSRRSGTGRKGGRTRKGGEEEAAVVEATTEEETLAKREEEELWV